MAQFSRTKTFLLQGYTSENNGSYYCINCLYSLETENRLKSHKNVCKSYEYCYIKIPEKDNNILKYTHGEQSIRVPPFIYIGTESLLEKIDTCHNNPKKTSRTKVNKHTSCTALFVIYTLLI